MKEKVWFTTTPAPVYLTEGPPEVGFVPKKIELSLLDGGVPRVPLETGADPKVPLGAAPPNGVPCGGDVGESGDDPPAVEVAGAVLDAMLAPLTPPAAPAGAATVLAATGAKPAIGGRDGLTPPATATGLDVAAGITFDANGASPAPGMDPVVRVPGSEPRLEKGRFSFSFRGK